MWYLQPEHSEFWPGLKQLNIVAGGDDGHGGYAS
jgi:hypothetical protein